MAKSKYRELSLKDADTQTMCRFVAAQTDVTDPDVQETCMDEFARVMRGEIKVQTGLRNMKQIIARSRSPSDA